MFYKFKQVLKKKIIFLVKKIIENDVIPRLNELDSKHLNFSSDMESRVKSLELSNSFNTLYDFIARGGVAGENVEVFPNVFFGGEPYLIEIGNNVRISFGVKFVTHDGGIYVLRHLYPEMQNKSQFGRIIIKDNVHIGWNSIIMPGVTINENSIIGCGSIVTKDVPANSIVAGNPARVIETLDEYYEKKRNSCFDTNTFSEQEKKDFLLKNKDFIPCSKKALYKI